MTTDTIRTGEAKFTISRLFRAPPARVWAAWTDPAQLAQWLGPKGTKTTVLASDMRPGGATHARMDAADGNTLWAKFVYREMVEPERLVYEHSFADAEANIVSSPFHAFWPLILLTNVVFEEEGDATRVTLTWTPLDATEDEREAFIGMIESMNLGWSGSFDQLDDLLSGD